MKSRFSYFTSVEPRHKERGLDAANTQESDNI